MPNVLHLKPRDIVSHIPYTIDSHSHRGEAFACDTSYGGLGLRSVFISGLERFMD